MQDMRLEMDPVEVRAATDHCRQTAPDLSFAAGLLQREARHGVCATWAVIHQLNVILDPVQPVEEEEQEGGCCGGGESCDQRAKVCAAVLDHLCSGEPTGKGELDGFKAAADFFEIKEAALSATIDARGEAMALRRFATWPRLRQTARRIAEPMVTTFFDAFADDPSAMTDAKREQAAAWATSLWLAAALGDFDRQFRAGRLTLPLDDLVKFKVRESEVAQLSERGSSEGHPQWSKLIAHHAGRLRLLNQGGSGCLHLLRSDARRAAATYAALVMSRLDALVAADGDVFRVKLPTLSLWQRVKCLPKSLRTIRAADERAEQVR